MRFRWGCWQMRFVNNAWFWACGGSLLLAACGGGEEGPRPPAPTARPAPAPQAVADEPVRIGPPYQVGGVTYTPEDKLDYDEVGYAGWYGEELQGNETANGERFLPSAVTAAHRTLPMPSYVEVTALDTGRTILVRINDRGPFSNDRIIDLSRGAAEQLGIIGTGATPVRVRRVNPPEPEKALLRAHGRAPERLETPAPLLAVLRKRIVQPSPTAAASLPPAAQPARTPGKRPSAPAASVPPPSSGGYMVQVAAFSSRQRAEALARRIGAIAVEGGGVWRVRYGPYATRDAARAGVKQAAAKGFQNAPIMANDGR
ncbi:hypothetical protein M529_10005 [Sphingobium ummariense RL-3]|uniref:Endolytic peptidoglycan transglycosylase RlpA n=2 Tax=Sphingobium TaxID=165695 RepID=T0J661_9SPHN|nr:hypothetical protein M529_10005 [Sphingobium ummariense RL-3]